MHSLSTELTPLLDVEPFSSDCESGGSAPKSKKIHLFSCISMALSMMTGAGIFIFPNMVLQGVQSGGTSLLVWTVAGLVSLLAGLCYSELALALPGSGGELVYLQRVFGKAPANLFLLTSAFVKYPAISIVLARSAIAYLITCIGSVSGVPSDQYLVCLAVMLIVGVACAMACYSTRLCTLLINSLNFCKLIGMSLILTFAVYVAIKAPDKEDIAERFSLRNTTTSAPAILLSLFGAIASYEGWNCLNLVAGEVHKPQRTMPIAITVATCVAVVLYLSCNVAYITVLPLDVMKSSNAVALDLGRIALGRYGEVLLSACVVASCLASVVALVICNSRLLQRAAVDGQVPEVFKFYLNRTSTPVFSISLHWLICAAFALITSLEALTTIVVIVSWVFYMLCFIAVLLLRYRDRVRASFRVPALIPFLLILFSVLLVLSPALTSTGHYRTSFVVTIVILLGLTPVSIVSTLPSLTTSDNSLVRASERVTKYIESFGTFS